jgi:mannose-1-phosphate guanylyltransferase/mannose-1-phosphate guanylyltransferase/mannose-6-phosphate isomerase
MFNDCIIMAGGAGTRLWPASNSRIPKQFLPMPAHNMEPNTGKPGSFFNAAIERALAVIDKKGDGRILIVSGRKHTPLIVAACQKYSANELSRMVLIPEPEAKNTAPAIACAVNYIDWMSGEDRKVLVLTSDHLITPLERFVEDAAAAAAFVQADKLAVFGIKPLGPETGYGYIEAGQVIPQMQEKPGVFKVLSFHEKPSREKAEEFLKAGNFFWNSGMFAFSSKFILGEYRCNAPELVRPFNRLRAPGETSFKTEQGLRILWDWLNLDTAYKETLAISFDYAIAEKSSHTVMVCAEFDWLDMGNWDEYALLARANNGDVYQVNTKNCFVDSDIPVALIGTEDLIIAVRSGKNGGPGSVLIAKKGETQRVREIVEQIKSRGSNELL